MSRALTIGLLALAGALLGSLVVRDTYASECAAQFAAGRWESVVEGGVYSHVLPLGGGVVVHNEEVTVGSYCHAAWKRAHAPGRRLEPPVLTLFGAVDRECDQAERRHKVGILYHDQAIANGSYDGTAGVWDLHTGHRLHTLHHGHPVVSVHAVGNRVITGSEDHAGVESFGVIHNLFRLCLFEKISAGYCNNGCEDWNQA